MSRDWGGIQGQESGWGLGLQRRPQRQHTRLRKAIPANSFAQFEWDTYSLFVGCCLAEVASERGQLVHEVLQQILGQLEESLRREEEHQAAHHGRHAQRLVVLQLCAAKNNPANLSFHISVREKSPGIQQLKTDSESFVHTRTQTKVLKTYWLMSSRKEKTKLCRNSERTLSSETMGPLIEASCDKHCNE